MMVRDYAIDIKISQRSERLSLAGRGANLSRTLDLKRSVDPERGSVEPFDAQSQGNKRSEVMRAQTPTLRTSPHATLGHLYRVASVLDVKQARETTVQMYVWWLPWGLIEGGSRPRLCKNASEVNSVGDGSCGPRRPNAAQTRQVRIAAMRG